MVGRLAPVILAVAISLVLGFVAFGATGVPTAPTVSFNTQLTPGTAQTILVPIYTQVYSTVSPNSVGWIGNSIVYSATATLSNGAPPTVLALAQTQVVNLISTNGSAYILGTTLSLTVPALCTASASCAAYTENITITAYALVGLLTKVQSGTSTIVLSTNPNFRANPGYPQASTSFYYLELWGSITALVTFNMWMAYVVTRHTALLAIAIAGTILLVPMVVLWW